MIILLLFYKDYLNVLIMGKHMHKLYNCIKEVYRPVAMNI
jgi:hypothetical protein